MHAKVTDARHSAAEKEKQRGEGRKQHAKGDAHTTKATVDKRHQGKGAGVRSFPNLLVNLAFEA